jgi:hypothetical protein
MKFPLLGHIAAFAYAIPVIAGGIRYSSFDNKRRIFFFYCLLNFIGVSIEYILAALGINNYIFINSFRIAEITAFVYVFHILIKEKSFHRIAKILLGLFFTVSLSTGLINSGTKIFKTADMFTTGFTHLILGGLLLYTSVYKNQTPIRNNFTFWIGSSIILYYSGAILIHSFGNLLYEMGMEYLNFVWHINWSLAIISASLFGYSFFCTTNE